MDLADRTIIPLTRGVHVVLEAEADRLLFEFLAGLKPAEKKDILTPSKWQDRLRHEVYVGNHRYRPDSLDSPADVDIEPFGPDASVRRGWFGRSANRGMLHLNSTYRTASVLPRHRGITMWDLRTEWHETFPVKISHL